MGKEEELKSVENTLSFWQVRIKNQKALDFLDMNRTAQDVTAKLLNEIYELDLANLDKENPNTSGIDLGDKKAGIAYQVTSRQDATKKIEENLETFNGSYKQEYPQGILFSFL